MRTKHTPEEVAAWRALAQIGGFQQWRKAGRMVRKGEHSIGSIFVPIGVSRDPEDGQDPDKVNFRLVPVFDITQTEEVTT